MGTIKQGILGGFSGKVGTVVGSSWKGISYIRSIPKSVHDPQTERQTAQRSKFAAAMQALKPLASLLNVTWKENVNQKSPINAAMSYTLKNAVAQQDGNWFVDYANFYIARGTLLPPAEVDVEPDGDAARITWADNSGTGNARATDVAVAVLINEGTGEVTTNSGAANRATGEVTIGIPAAWGDATTHLYLAFVALDGRVASNSVYLH